MESARTGRRSSDFYQELQNEEGYTTSGENIQLSVDHMQSELFLQPLTYC